jgi:hypothetical protein
MAIFMTNVTSRVAHLTIRRGPTESGREEKLALGN